MTSTLRYDPYGTIVTGAPQWNRIYAYNGEQYTPQTGLVYLRARNYDPATGTFTSRDTYLGDMTNPVTRNRYTYANNNPVMYQDPSGHAGIFSKLANAVKTAAKKVTKAATKKSSSVVKKSSSSSKKKVTASNVAASSSSKSKTTSSSSSKSSVKAVVNKAKQEVKKAATVYVNKAKAVTKTAIWTAKSVAGNFHENPEAGYEYVKETTSRYISSKVKTVKQTASKAWEGTKDVIESGLTLIIRGEQKATELIQNASAWWNGLDTVQAVRKKAEQINTTWKNSPIGSKVTALQEQTNSAARHLYESWANGSMGEWYNETKNSITTFYEENKTAVNSIGGVAIIAGCAAAAYIGGEAACTALAVAATEAAKGALLGGAIGAPAGGFSNLLDYMKEHGTIDGSTNDVLEGMSEGFVKGAFAGAIAGFLKGSIDYAKNPDAYCFVAGTFVTTAVGMSCIEDIRPGDYVYAKNEITGEQAYMPVLETYINEIHETYTVTIDGESIETTPGHPFYTTDRGWVGADKLKAGDSVELSDGSSAEVESVERNEFEEPIIIYNLCVMDYHTYYVGENGVLVHNVGRCGPGGAQQSAKPTSQSQMQRQVEKGQAPKAVDRVDPPHVEGQQPHIHFGENEAALNFDGSWHDAGKGIPNIGNKISKWITQNGWNLPWE